MPYLAQVSQLVPNVFFKVINLEVVDKQKVLTDLYQLGLFCTQSRDRTGMEVNPLVFETSASTNSAIWAF